MACSVLARKNSNIEIDIFSNKSSLILFFLLIKHKQAEADGFSMNYLARETQLSIGLVHKVIHQLEYDGIITSEGLRTNKKFYLKSPNKILFAWIQKYNLLKKTKTKGFSALNLNSKNLFSTKSGLVPALHTAVSEYFHFKSTNLRTKEYYVLDWEQLSSIAIHLELHEMDRGYEILLIKPYYSSLLKNLTSTTNKDYWMKAYMLLTLLDLCHFPLRGVEQAETFFRKNDFLKSICSWSEIEHAIG